MASANGIGRCAMELFVSYWRCLIPVVPSSVVALFRSFVRALPAVLVAKGSWEVS